MVKVRTCWESSFIFRYTMRGELSTIPAERPLLIFLMDDTWWQTDPTVTTCHGDAIDEAESHIAVAHMLSMAIACSRDLVLLPSAAKQCSTGCSLQWARQAAGRLGVYA